MAKAEEVEVVVIGGAVAGLGTAIALARNHKKSVLVLEKDEWKLDGNDRFTPGVAASFKNAGVLDTGNLMGPTVKEYFAQNTLDLFKEAGAPVIDCGSYVAAEKRAYGFFLSCGSRLDTRLLDRDVLEQVYPPRGEGLENLRVPSSSSGMFKLKSGSKAEPEQTMHAILNVAKNTPGLTFRPGSEVVDMRFAAHMWHVKTSDACFSCKQLVIAAGPGSMGLLRQLGLQLPVKHVYGVMGQSYSLAEEWFDGGLLGARAEGDWLIRDIFTPCSYSLNGTSWFGEDDSWTTHLYMNTHTHVDSKAPKLCLGGPRILLPDDVEPGSLEPEQFRKEFAEAAGYLKRLVVLPKLERPASASKSSVWDSLWGGMMVFPADDDKAFVGPIEGLYETADGNPSLFLSTGWASSGFREAFGAGEFLARVMVDGTNWIKKEDDRNLRSDWKALMPTTRIRPVSSGPGRTPRNLRDIDQVRRQAAAKYAGNEFETGKSSGTRGGSTSRQPASPDPLIRP